MSLEKRYPCAECIVKVVCKVPCYKLIKIHKIHKRMNEDRCCPDCGSKEGTKFDGMYDNIIECNECRSSFFPVTQTTIFRNEKGPDRDHHRSNIEVIEFDRYMYILMNNDFDDFDNIRGYV